MSKKIKTTQCEMCLGRKRSLFSGLDQEMLCAVDKQKSTIQHDKGQLLFLEGTTPLGLFCINEGKVKIYKTGESGKEQIIRIAQAGDFIGYRALLADETYASSAAILEEAKVCFIPKESFVHVMTNDTDFRKRLMKEVCHELGIVEQKVADLSQKSVRERLAGTLLMLKETYGIDGEKSQLLNIALTREDLANLVGTATETVIRLLSEFNKDGLIELNGKKIKILQADKLAREANFYG
jgi:CRP-like cAMP-binding protein